jgi:transcriptional regulator with XRE-family HTH domain
MSFCGDTRDILSCIMTAGTLIRTSRRQLGLSQRTLALRAGTTQAWISAIERDHAHPSVEMVRRLLLVMGEELVIDSRPLPGHAQHDPVAFENTRRQSVDDRLTDGLNWMRLSAR